MKTALLLFLMMITLPIRAQEYQDVKYIDILPQSHILVRGDAKVTRFTCEFDLEHLKAPTAVQYHRGNSRIIFNDTELLLENRGFDCGNRNRNEDFHEMVQTEQHPHMKLELKEVNFESDSKVIATAGITIAGEENIYRIPVRITPGETPRFQGTFQVNIRDFGLEPIKKILGLIVVQDIIEIELDLSIRMRNKRL